MTVEIGIVLGILTVLVIFLVFELFRIDIVAILCMLALAWFRILTPSEAISGFSSNAVISMMAVMIMGHGIARTGIMNAFAEFVVRLVGNRKRRIIGVISLAVGGLSAFMQNVGAAALFLPAVLNISKKERIPASNLIMPLGFAAILGGTLSMVASGPLILLNDLLRSADLKPYDLFSVTPVGLLLLGTGIIFFFLFGSWVLPRGVGGGEIESNQKKLIDAWHLPHTVFRYEIPADSNLEMSWDVFGGRYGDVILGLIKQRCLEDGLATDEDVLAQQLRLHVHRGLAYLAGNRKLRSVADLINQPELRSAAGSRTQPRSRPQQQWQASGNCT